MQNAALPVTGAHPKCDRILLGMVSPHRLRVLFGWLYGVVLAQADLYRYLSHSDE